MSTKVEEFVETQSKYSQAVIDHWRNPRNPGPMKNPDGHARFKGPCGDTIEMFIRVSKDERITDASFMTDGCMTTIASASMAVELAIGRSLPAAKRISQDLILEKLGGLPEESRHCALLAAKAFRAAVENYSIMKDIPLKYCQRIYQRD
ncbi:MAG: iron-sulfur cluster assembly scaffold protein [Proteobacteria bacterium]|nr:iron-sulfur cluster assembly scaffold protein [Pseudomonadota bacterium]